MLKKILTSDSLLLLAAFIWGTAFVAQRKGMDHIGPMAFTGIRFLIGSLVLLPVLLHTHIYKKPPKSDKRFLIIGSSLAGLALFAGAALQQIGLVHTTAGKAGFITGLYVVIVVIFGLFLGHKIKPAVWLGCILAVAGLYLLTAQNSFTIERGDLFVLASAFFWAVHVQMLGYLAKRLNPLSLACIQFFACGLLSLAVAFFTETITIEMISNAKWAILYGGVMSVGIAFSIQVISQRTCPPAHAAIIMSTEAVFAAIAGCLILGETLAPKQLLGCALMLAGMLAVQLIALPKNTRS